MRLGATYKDKYLDGVQNLSTLVKNDGKYENCIKQYHLKNRPDAPVFLGVLYIMKNGSAIMEAKYTSYSGRKNKYTNYFDLNGKEIIHETNSTREEKKYYDNMGDIEIQKFEAYEPKVPGDIYRELAKQFVSYAIDSIDSVSLESLFDSFEVDIRSQAYWNDKQHKTYLIQQIQTLCSNLHSNAENLK